MDIRRTSLIGIALLAVSACAGGPTVSHTDPHGIVVMAPARTASDYFQVQLREVDGEQILGDHKRSELRQLFLTARHGATRRFVAVGGLHAVIQRLNRCDDRTGTLDPLEIGCQVLFSHAFDLRKRQINELGFQQHVTERLSTQGITVGCAIAQSFSPGTSLVVYSSTFHQNPRGLCCNRFLAIVAASCGRNPSFRGCHLWIEICLKPALHEAIQDGLFR